MRILKTDVLKALDYPHLVFNILVDSSQDISKKRLNQVDLIRLSPEAKIIMSRLGLNCTVGELLVDHVMAYVGAATFDQVKPDKGLSPQEHLIKHGKYLDLLSCLGADLWYRDEKDIPKKLKVLVEQLFPKYFDVNPR